MKTIFNPVLLSLLPAALCAVPTYSRPCITMRARVDCIETNVKLEKGIDTSKVKIGDPVIVDTIMPLESEDRNLQIPSGHRIFGRVILAASRANGEMDSELALKFDSIVDSKGKQLPIVGSLRAFLDSTSANLYGSGGISVSAPNIKSLTMFQNYDTTGNTGSPIRIEMRALDGVEIPALVADQKTLKLSSDVELQVDVCTVDGVCLYNSHFGTAEIKPEAAADNLIGGSNSVSLPADKLGGQLGGDVVLEVLISRSGTVRQIKVKQGPELLAEAAVTTVKL